MKAWLGVIAGGLFASGCIIDHADGPPDDADASFTWSSTCSTGGSSSRSGSSGGSADSAAGSESTPPPPPACAELPDEHACELRGDCQAIYAGTDCSCGPNCTCFDGTEGCTCEHFAYFACVALDPP